MASVTITDLLMLVAVLFILYFISSTLLSNDTFNIKTKKEDFANTVLSTLPSTRPVEKNKNCSQASINQNSLDYIFNGKHFVR
jgi:hypothetical protein